MLTSALKRVDVAVEDLTKLAKDGTLKVGRRLRLQPQEQRRRARLRQQEGAEGADVARTNAIGKLIGRGKIKVKPIIKFKASN